MPYEHRYLVMVDPIHNNNKYYRMTRIPQSNMWRAEYGRVGSTPMKKNYPLSAWEQKYDEKIAKGYVDQSDKICVSIQTNSKYREIENVKIRDFINRLLNYASQQISASYSITVENVTETMIMEAQNLINNLYVQENVESFNQILIKLYAVLPRKIKDVKKTLLKSMEETAEIIEREQDLLDVMKGQVKVSTLSTKNNSTNKTLLEEYGLTVTEPSDKEMEEILSHLGNDKSRLKAAYKIINQDQEEKFKTYCNKRSIKKCKYLYHGSRNENFWNIITNGLLLNPNAVITGKMFGHGLYFASLAHKSIKYTSLRNLGFSYAHGTSDSGLLAVYKVATGKPWDIFQWDMSMTKLREKDMLSKGYDSVYAHKGINLVNDEFIVYNESAATLRYLIELQ